MADEPNYRRTKPGVRSTQHTTNGAAGPSSQIPGLSSTANNTEPEARTKGRRVGVQASDSDYVKLAKQGGQRGLLWHDDPVEADPNNSYKPSNWFTSDEQDGKATTPDGVIKSQSPGADHKLEPPFGTDNFSSWESDKVDNAASGMQKLSLSQKDIDDANKFKKTSHDKKGEAPVSMSALLGFGYVEEKKLDDDASSITSEQTSTIAPEEELE
ncbi:uncharacterized protein C7orf57 homolog [Triplophysa dalaica]|uniref:uncharacterized protein C7orf57 homolog n=1 Tax=Triplophysa dalaica TaxID=1582913 RepID=UPI0024DF522B|nr:uncharacterized protein C7orf57 homolog [Triplophysa dalaica]